MKSSIAPSRRRLQFGEPSGRARPLVMQNVSASPSAGDFALSAVPEHVSNLGRLNILLVEDDEGQRKTLEALFVAANEKNYGAVQFDVTGVESAEAAIAELNKHDRTHYQIILLDVSRAMPRRLPLPT